jgi:hypothetical protein
MKVQVLIDADTLECTAASPGLAVGPGNRFAHAACPVPAESGEDRMAVLGGMSEGSDHDDCWLWTAAR